MSMMLTSAVLTSKVIRIGPTITLAGVVVVPIVFSISDIIAEIYGYKIATLVIWTAFILQFIFAIICDSMIHISSPTFWHGQEAYDFVVGPLLRISIFSFIAYIISSIVNVYVISKWKVLWKNRLFWLRSIGSSTLGECLFTIFAVILIQFGKMSFQEMLKVMISSYIIKIISTIIFAFPSSMIVSYINYKLKKAEQIKKSENEIVPFRVKI